MKRPAMTWFSAARESLRSVFFRSREEDEMTEELRFHLEMESNRLQHEAGLSQQEARRRAHVAFGGVERYKEEVRHERGAAWVFGAVLDLKLGIRMLIKYPALTLVGGLGMAVAIATTVGFFAFAQTHIYPALPLEEGERIVALENRDIELNDEERRSLHDFVQWRSELKSIEELAAFRTVERNLSFGNFPPQPVRIAEMTAAGFRVARIEPLLGRYLLVEDERPGAPAVAVIGYDAWHNRFGGDDAIVGRQVHLSGRAHTIIGVMPKAFAFPMDHQFWTPLATDVSTYPRRKGPAIFIFGRLGPGVSMEQAQAELEAVGGRTAAAFPDSHAKLRPMVMPYIHSLTDIQGMTTWMVVQMQMMMSLLLVVVALNVAVLVYARTATRQGEIAVRTALGASRARIVTQLFLEALALSFAAAAVGLGLAQVGVRLGNGILETELGAPFWTNYSLQPVTVLFSVAVTLFAAAVVGILPALQVTGRRLQGNLRQLGGNTSMRLGKTWTFLVIAQIAIAVAALPAAVNMGLSEIRTAATQPLYPAAEFLWAEMSSESPAEADGAVATPREAAVFGERLRELMRLLNAEPGVVGATWSGELPGRGGAIEIEGVPSRTPSGHRVASHGGAPGYLDVYGAQVLTGRGLGPGDADASGTAVIVNRTFVQKLLGGEPALGRRIRYVDDGSGAGEPKKSGPWYEIVGVVEDLQRNWIDPDLVQPRIFYPMAPSQVRQASVEIRLHGLTPADFAPRLRELAAVVDPTLRLGSTHSRAEFERQAQLAVRLVALLIILVLLSVFLLSAAGVYALTSFTVTQRRREIGIRSALGGDPGQVLRSVFAGVARQIGLGLVLGISAAALIDTASGGELMGGRAGVLLPAFGVLMLIVAVLAAIGPARRGLRIEPAEALRADL